MKKVMSLSVLFSLFMLVACGGGDNKKEEKETMKIGSQKTETAQDTNSATLALSGNDMMQFDKNELKVKAGQEVTLNFRHIGKLDKKVMGHNFVLLQPGTDIQEFSMKASEAGEALDWIPEEGKEVLVHTKMLGGGESTSITFTAPAAGTYDFICSFPGHSAMMKGKFIVE
ncbi:MAG: azurin [Flavobacteriaceae bacterium]